MIFKNLLRRKARTIITVLGISIGVMAIISLGALADGLQAGYNSMLSGSRADLVLGQPDAMDISYSSVEEKVGNDLLAMPEVEAISGMLQGIVQTEGTPYFFVFGFPENSFILDRFNIIDGVGLYDREVSRQKGKPILLGSAAAETFEKAPGDTIRLTGSVYRIVGIYQTGDGFEDSGAVLTISEAQNLLGKQHQVSLYYIKLKKSADRERLEQRVTRLWPKLSLSSTSEFGDKQILDDSLRGFVWVIAGLAIILGGVGMMNATLMSIMERTREIGVLRAVGWSSRRIMLMILGESIVVSFIGGVIGAVGGWLLIYMLSKNTVLFGANSGSIHTGLILQALITVFVLGVTGGVYPAWRASQLQPVEAIRYEGGSSGKHVHRLPFGGMALQSLWQRRVRTILTLSVIALTVGAIMALEGIIQGLSSDLTKMAIGSDAEIMIRQADVSDTSLSAIDERIGEKIAAFPEIANVSGMAMTAIMLPEDNSFFIILGFAPNESAIRKYRMVEGEALYGNRQIIIGRRIAESLNTSVGKTIELAGNRFKVVGIFESGISWEEMGGVITLRDAQTFMGRPRKVTMYMVKLVDPRDAPEVVDKINKQHPDLHASLSGEFADQMPDMEATDSMLGAISIMAILVGGLGVMNTMLMSVLERTREIGVLRALGWRRRIVLKMILKESLLLSFIGGMVGVLVAFFITFSLNNAPMLGGMISSQWSIGVFVRAITVSVTLGVFGGLYPAIRATNLHPIEALRYE